MKYEEMTEKEIENQLEHSDPYEFSYGLAKYLLEDNKLFKQELLEANESITWWMNRYNAMERNYKLVNKQLDETTKKIVKAIEYIENRYDYEQNVLIHTLDKDNLKELIEILKGDSNV